MVLLDIIVQSRRSLCLQVIFQKKNIVDTSTNETFKICDRVRVLFEKYSRGAIGAIVNIGENEFLLMTDERAIVLIPYEKVMKLRQAACSENFATVPYYDEQERKFWKTHSITKDGIQKLTAFDKKILNYDSYVRKA